MEIAAAPHPLESGEKYRSTLHEIAPNHRVGNQKPWQNRLGWGRMERRYRTTGVDIDPSQTRIDSV